MVRVTLTIDNGPTVGVTENVLETLRKKDVTATFFVVGEQVTRPGGQDLVARIHGEGHRVGNHTFTHSVLFGEEPNQAKVIAEIDRTQDALGPFGEERLFRPFAGGGCLDHRVMSRTAYDHLSARRYTMVLWNSIPQDWIDPEGWHETALEHLGMNDWTVTIIHDRPTGAMDRLGTFIERARDRGVEFRADFPVGLMPLVAGEKRLPIDDLLSDR